MVKTHRNKTVTARVTPEEHFFLRTVVSAQLTAHPSPLLADPTNFLSKKGGNEPLLHQTTRIGHQHDVPFLKPFIRIAATNA